MFFSHIAVIVGAVLVTFGAPFLFAWKVLDQGVRESNSWLYSLEGGRWTFTQNHDFGQIDIVIVMLHRTCPQFFMMHIGNAVRLFFSHFSHKVFLKWASSSHFSSRLPKSTMLFPILTAPNNIRKANQNTTHTHL